MIGLNAEKTKHICIVRLCKTVENLNINLANKSLEKAAEFKYCETKITDQNKIE
jgi:hypothetical protein